MKTYTIDSKGNRWVWNCGWYIVDKNGVSKRTQRKPLSHAEFKRCVTILNPGIKAQREVLHAMDRPGRAWRRFVDRDSWEHNEFGKVYLLASDGCHAVVETVDGEHVKVCFENLSEPKGVPLPPRIAKPKSERKKVAVTETGLKITDMVSRYLSLAKPSV